MTTRVLALNDHPSSARAAAVPRAVARTDAARATWKLVRAASVQVRLVSRWRNQRRESPGVGNCRYAPELKPFGRTTMNGDARNTRATPAATSMSAPRIDGLEGGLTRPSPCHPTAVRVR